MKSLLKTQQKRDKCRTVRVFPQRKSSKKTLGISRSMAETAPLTSVPEAPLETEAARFDIPDILEGLQANFRSSFKTFFDKTELMQSLSLSLRLLLSFPFDCLNETSRGFVNINNPATSSSSPSMSSPSKDRLLSNGPWLRRRACLSDSDSSPSGFTPLLSNTSDTSA